MKKENSNKKRLPLLALIFFIIAIILLTLILIWSKSDINKISANDYKYLVMEEAEYVDIQNNPDEYKNDPNPPNPANYKNGKVKEFTATAAVGGNTTIVYGTIVIADDKGNLTDLKYSSEWDKNDFSNFLSTTYTYTYTYTESDQTKTVTVEHPKFSYFDVAAGTNFSHENAALKGGFNTYDREYVPAWESALMQLIPIILYLGVFMYIGYRIFKMQGGSGGMSPFSMGKSKAKKTKTDIKFSDVAGINEEKEELVELVDYLKNPQKYSAMGARAPKGILMEGSPGTGKTLLAKAVAGEAGVPFFSISGSEFEEMFVGVGASRIREMFNDAKKSAPCIIFIDEIDAVGRKRSANIGTSTNEQTLNQLLVEMDGFGTNSGVIVIAATNRVDVLDPALLRPGRFDRQIQIALPNIKEREAILKLHARNKNISSAVDFKRLAERTPGFSGAQLENVLNEAAILAVRQSQKIINIQTIDEAIDRVVGGPAKKSRNYTITDKDIVSYHEAGHALIGVHLDAASTVQKVTIIPRGNAGGYTIMTPKEETIFHSKENLYATITGYLGGRASEEIMFGKNKITTGAHDDLEKATNIARHMVTEYGMSSLGLAQFESQRQIGQPKWWSEDVSKEIDKEIKKILDSSYEAAKNIISANKEELGLIAESLKILETITAEQIDYIHKNMKLPEEVIEEKKQREERDKKKEKGDILEVSPNN